MVDYTQDSGLSCSQNLSSAHKCFLVHLQFLTLCSNTITKQCSPRGSHTSVLPQHNTAKQPLWFYKLLLSASLPFVQSLNCLPRALTFPVRMNDVLSLNSIYMYTTVLFRFVIEATLNFKHVVSQLQIIWSSATFCCAHIKNRNQRAEVFLEALPVSSAREMLVNVPSSSSTSASMARFSFSSSSLVSFLVFILQSQSLVSELSSVYLFLSFTLFSFSLHVLWPCLRTHLLLNHSHRHGYLPDLTGSSGYMIVMRMGHHSNNWTKTRHSRPRHGNIHWSNFEPQQP